MDHHLAVRGACYRHSKLSHLSRLLVMRRQKMDSSVPNAVQSILARFDENSAQCFAIFADILYLRMNPHCCFDDACTSFARCTDLNH